MSLIYKEGQYYGKGGAEMPAEDMAEVASPLPSVMSRRFKYSTEEQIVGEWIDGKPIYQKTIDIGSLPNNNSKTVAHNISNIDYCVQLFGMVKSTNDMLILPAVATNATYQAYLAIDATSIKLLTAANLSNYSGYVTARYTKTTD